MFRYFSTFDFRNSFVDSNQLYQNYVNLTITLFRKNVNLNVLGQNTAVKRKKRDNLIKYQLGLLRIQMISLGREKKGEYRNSLIKPHCLFTAHKICQQFGSKNHKLLNPKTDFLENKGLSCRRIGAIYRYQFPSTKIHKKLS